MILITSFAALFAYFFQRNASKNTQKSLFNFGEDKESQPNSRALAFAKSTIVKFIGYSLCYCFLSIAFSHFSSSEQSTKLITSELNNQPSDVPEATSLQFYTSELPPINRINNRMLLALKPTLIDLVSSVHSTASSSLLSRNEKPYLCL